MSWLLALLGIWHQSHLNGIVQLHADLAGPSKAMPLMLDRLVWIAVAGQLHAVVAEQQTS